MLGMQKQVQARLLASFPSLVMYIIGLYTLSEWEA